MVTQLPSVVLLTQYIGTPVFPQRLTQTIQHFDSNDPTLINVVNDIRTAETGVKEYEFFNIPFEDFEDNQGNPFATAQDAADYITAQCHVIDTSTQLSPNGQLYVDAVNGSDNPFADGTINRPFLTIQNAYNNASDGDTLLISKGTYTETVSLSGTKGVTFKGIGQDDVIIQAGSGFTAGKDSNVFQLSESAAGKSFKFTGMTIKNGKFGIMASGATASIYVQDCTFQTLGWSAGGMSLRNPASGSTLGYDSPASGLQAFASGAHVSDGGAIYALSSTFVSFLDNKVRYNNDGIRLEDCLQGFVSRNQVHDNLTTGLDLTSSSDDANNGSDSVVAYNNFFAYNGANGIACEGGIKNTFALNEIEGNWNAGVVINHASEATIRDSKLVDNNKSSVNALGQTGLADATIHVAGGTIKAEAKFLAHILDTQILNSNVGGNSTRVGICLDSNLDGINNRITGQISIDDVLFADQDSSIVVNCNLDNIRLTIGDCHYIDSTNKNVVVNGEGMYHEFPFSNHMTNMQSVDFTYDAVAESVNILDGLSGDVVNTYHINQLRAEEHDGQLRVYLRATKKVQLEGVEPGNVYVNGASAGSTINQIVNTLNALFTKTGGSTETGTSTNPVNSSGTLTTNNTSSDVFDPVGSGDFAKSGSYVGAIWTDETIDQIGEHYTFLIENEGTIGFGVRDTCTREQNKQALRTDVLTMVPPNTKRTMDSLRGKHRVFHA
jgi:parallel beta-helix repeat protein